MKVDARSVVDGGVLTADLCIVGAGPAGISIAHSLRDSGLRIVLVEGGGLEPKVSAQDLYRGENVGHPYLPLHTCRFRLFGGTTNRWGGWCRPLEPLDFERRDWVARSGWPIGSHDVEPYYERAADLLQLPSPRFDLEAWAHTMPAPLALDGTDFENTLIQYSPQTNFGEVYGPHLFGARNVTTLLQGSVTELRLEPGTSRVSRACVAADDGRRFAIEARAFVLATGGIENPRLLLASRTDRSAGLGNERDLVGRFFMEHPHVGAGHLIPTATGVPGAFYGQSRFDGAILRGFVAPTVEAQARRRLLNFFASLEPSCYEYGSAYLGWPPELMFGPIRLYRRLRRTTVAPLADRTKGLAERAFFERRKLRTRGYAREAAARAHAPDARGLRSLFFRSEQAPDPESRVSLGRRRDRFGVPVARLDWRVNRVDTDSILGWLGALDESFARVGIGRIVMPREGWEEAITGGPHHMGTTRMSATAAEGVVDEQCRIHTLDNLYVAGSSVFATSGYANPTFTIVALALRLADRLRDTLGGRERGPALEPPHSCEPTSVV